MAGSTADPKAGMMVVASAVKKVAPLEHSKADQMAGKSVDLSELRWVVRKAAWTVAVMVD